jgi:hypothetical protein
MITLLMIVSFLNHKFLVHNYNKISHNIHIILIISRL